MKSPTSESATQPAFDSGWIKRDAPKNQLAKNGRERPSTDFLRTFSRTWLSVQMGTAVSLAYIRGEMQHSRRDLLTETERRASSKWRRNRGHRSASKRTLSSKRRESLAWSWLGSGERCPFPFGVFRSPRIAITTTITLTLTRVPATAYGPPSARLRGMDRIGWRGS